MYLVFVEVLLKDDKISFKELPSDTAVVTPE